ncbi:tryptophan synthase subunit alpha [Solidesulfovibrio sp. C21]|uniref:tryptophan synthase subunit alpha n=1 Tax=Solidesulfovibrio sp. C21 TaxID=3398613 RepID=UPI0039FC526A
MSQSILTTRIMEALAAGRKALIPFLPGGFPDKERFFDELDALDAGGADIIEIGVPFSDPVADGPVVEQASLDCLLNGTCLSWILHELERRKGRYKAGLVLMGYYNPFLQYGLENLAEDAAAAGVSGFIVPDLPLEEAGPMAETLGKHDLDLIPLVGLNTSEERLAAYAAHARGFVYFVSVLGTTGMRETLPAEIAEHLASVRRIFDVPVALGFGIKSPEQLIPFGDSIDAVVFGSALIAHIETGGTAAEFMQRWRS